MNTKRMRAARWILLAGITTLLVTGCPQGGETIQDRINSFVAAINSGVAASVQANTDPAAESYNTAATWPFWDTHYPSRPYTVSSISVSGRTATVRLTSTGTALDQVFEMSEEAGGLFQGSTFKVRRIRNSSSTDYFFK